jgi:hypothetical protein
VNIGEVQFEREARHVRHHLAALGAGDLPLVKGFDDVTFA